MAVSGIGRCLVIGRTEPCGDCLLTDSIETSTLDHLTLIEDIAMTSAVLILALSGVGGLHGKTYASGQCPPPPCKTMPSCQAPSKCPPCPTKCPPAPCKSPCAPKKCLPSCQAPAKCAPSGQYGSGQAGTSAAPQM
jgi:hypothetical protein